MRAFREKIKIYLQENSDKPAAMFWLRVISFAESSFFPIPPDPFQIALTLAKPEKWKEFAKNIVIFSVFGGIFGYAIGYWFFDFYGPFLIELYNLQDDVARLETFFEDTSFISIFIAALTPIPYKLFTITAGLFNVNLVTFILASVLGRGIRFYAVGWVARFLGEKYAEKIFKHLDLISFVLGALILLYLLYKYL